MTERIQKQASATTRSEAEVEAPVKGEQADTSITDELLDEIDSVLEENAEAFVRSYVQKGGE